MIKTLKRNFEIKIYTIIMLFFSAVILFIFSIKGNSLVWTADGFNQFYPVLVYLRNYLSDVIHTGFFKQFDFCIGLGEGVIPVLNYYGFGDPFTAVLLIVPVNKVIYCLWVIVLMKLYCAGLSFIYCCKMKGYKNSWIIIMSAIFYSFSLYALVQGFQFWTFLTPLITIPLMTAGIDALIDNRKKKLPIFLLISSVFLQSLNGFYFLYMAIVFSASYFLIKAVLAKVFLHLKTLFWVGVRIAGCYLLGMAMAGEILIPTLLAYFSSSRMIDANTKIGLFHSTEKYMEYLGNLVISRAFEPGLGVCGILVLSIILLFSRKNKDRSLKCLFIFWGIGYVSPILGSVMNGFSYSSDRWFFILYFIISLVFVEVFGVDRQNIIPKRNELLIYLGIICLSLYTHVIYNNISFSSGLRIFIFSLISILPAVYFCIRRNVLNSLKIERFIITYSIICVLVNIVMIYGPTRIGGSGFRAGFKTYAEVEESFETSKAIGLQSNNEFYRLDVQDSSYASSLIIGYYGTSEYYSIINGNVFNFFNEMKISPGIRGSSWTLKGLDSRVILENLLSVKYYSDYVIQNNERNMLIRNNESMLPFGFTYSKYMKKDEFDKLTFINKMDAMAQFIIVDKVPDDIENGTYIETDFEIPYTIKYENIKIKDDNLYVDENSRIIIQPQKNCCTSAGELYLELIGLERYATEENRNRTSIINIGNKDIEVLDSEYSKEVGVKLFDYSIHVNSADHIPEKITIQFTEKEIYKVENISLYLYPDDIMKKRISSERNTLEDIKKSGDCIQGVISLSKPEMLFFSIPYSKGWKAFVDNKEVDIQLANIGFMGIPLKSGVHNIKLIYITPGLIIGIGFSLIGWGGVVSYAIYIWKKRKKANES